MTISARVYYSKVRFAWDINKKGYILVNLEQIEDQISLHSMQIESFLRKNISKMIQEGHCARVPHTLCLN